MDWDLLRERYRDALTWVESFDTSVTDTRLIAALSGLDSAIRRFGESEWMAATDPDAIAYREWVIDLLELLSVHDACKEFQPSTPGFRA